MPCGENRMASKPFRGFPYPDFNGFKHGCQSRLKGVQRDLNPSFSAFWRNNRMRPPFCTRNSLAKGGFFHKKVSQSLERRFVGFVEPSNRRSFCVSGQIKGGSPERSSICENQQGHWRGGSMSGSQRPTSRARRSRYFAPKTSDAVDALTPPTVLSAGRGGRDVHRPGLHRL